MFNVTKLLNPPVHINLQNGILPKGEYNAATAYVLGDVVSYAGQSYICIQNSTGNLPTNTTYFQLFYEKNPGVKVTVGKEKSCDYVCDGDNDSQQMNAAISYVNNSGGGSILVKAGTYTPSQIIYLKNNVSIIGEGKNNTLFVPKVEIGNNALFYYTGSLALPLTDCSLQGFGIDGINMPVNIAQTGTKGVNIYFSKRLYAHDLHIKNTPATGFGPDNNIDMIVSDCIVENCGRSLGQPGFNGFGIGCGGSVNERSVFVNCIAINNGNNGFLEEYVAGGNNSRHMLFVNCIAEGNKRGFRVSGAGNIVFSNCHSYNNTEDGFFLQLFGAQNSTADNITMVANQSHNNGGSGILFHLPEDENFNPIIIGNNSYNNNGYGIATGGDRAKINNNISHNNGKTGILYSGESATGRTAISIESNTVYNNGKAGVAGERSGIRVRGLNASGITNGIVSHNICYDDQPTKTQAEGICLKEYVSGFDVSDNHLEGNVTPLLFSLHPSATGNFAQNNRGINPDVSYSIGGITGATTVTRVNGQFQTATLTGNITLTIDNGFSVGDTLALQFTQDATGGRTVTWPGNFKKSGGTLVLSTAPNAIDVVTMRWNGTNWIEVNRSLSVG